MLNLKTVYSKIFILDLRCLSSLPLQLKHGVIQVWEVWVAVSGYITQRIHDLVNLHVATGGAEIVSQYCVTLLDFFKISLHQTLVHNAKCKRISHPSLYMSFFRQKLQLEASYLIYRLSSFFSVTTIKTVTQGNVEEQRVCLIYKTRT